MARKVVNRKELRAENDAAEAQAKPPAKRRAAAGRQKRQSQRREEGPRQTQEPQQDGRARAPKLFWGVFNQSPSASPCSTSLQKKAADAKAAELSASGKKPALRDEGQRGDHGVKAMLDHLLSFGLTFAPKTGYMTTRQPPLRCQLCS